MIVRPAFDQPGKVLGLKDGELQAYFDSDGAIKWAGGKGVANATGISHTQDAQNYWRVTPDTTYFMQIHAQGGVYLGGAVLHAAMSGSGGTAVHGEVESGTGLYGFASLSGNGVVGTGYNGGVVGISTHGYGVEGRGSATAAGVFGWNGTYGVEGAHASLYAVYGHHGSVAQVVGDTTLMTPGTAVNYGVWGRVNGSNEVAVVAEATVNATTALKIIGGGVDGGSQRYTNLANAISDTDALNRQTADGRYARLAGGGAGYLVSTGATVGATSQAQTFTNGIIGPTWKPAADSTTALQIQNAGGTAMLTFNMVNSRINIGPVQPSRFSIAYDHEKGANDQHFAITGVTDPLKRLAIAFDTTNNYTYITAWKEGVGYYPLCLNPDGGQVGIGTAAPGALLDVRGSAIFNEAGADVDFRIEGDTNANLFCVDASTDRIGIGTNAPYTALDVRGTGIFISDALGGQIECRNLSALGKTLALGYYYDGGSTDNGLINASQEGVGAKPLWLQSNGGDTRIFGKVGFGDVVPTTQLHVKTSDAVTNAVSDILTIDHTSTGTPAAGFGSGVLFQLRSSTTDGQGAAQLAVAWTDATHATRTSKATLNLVSSAAALAEVMSFAPTEVVVNDTGNATTDLRAETDTEASMLLVDASADIAYIGGTTNGVKIAKGGNLTLLGTATQWEDLRVEPVARTTGSNAPTFEKWYDDAAGTSRGVWLYSFDDVAAGSEKEIFFTMQLPHAWASTAISMHVHWIGSHDDTTADPRWGLEYAWKDVGEVFGDTTIVYSDGTHITFSGADADVTLGKHYITEFADLTPGSTADNVSSVLIGRLFRNSSDAGDTYNVGGNKCGLLYIDAHYEVNSFGSNTEYTK